MSSSALHINVVGAQSSLSRVTGRQFWIFFRHSSMWSAQFLHQRHPHRNKSWLTRPVLIFVVEAQHSLGQLFEIILGMCSESSTFFFGLSIWFWRLSLICSSCLVYFTSEETAVSCRQLGAKLRANI